MQPGDKVQAIGAPRGMAPSGCEAPREQEHFEETAIVVQRYADRIRVCWSGHSLSEAGWRGVEDFRLIK